jgi:hypothetical protein
LPDFEISVICVVTTSKFQRLLWEEKSYCDSKLDFASIVLHCSVCESSNWQHSVHFHDWRLVTSYCWSTGPVWSPLSHLDSGIVWIVWPSTHQCSIRWRTVMIQLQMNLDFKLQLCRQGSNEPYYVLNSKPLWLVLF